MMIARLSGFLLLAAIAGARTAYAKTLYVVESTIVISAHSAEASLSCTDEDYPGIEAAMLDELDKISPKGQGLYEGLGAVVSETLKFQKSRTIDRQRNLRSNLRHPKEQQDKQEPEEQEDHHQDEQEPAGEQEEDHRRLIYYQQWMYFTRTSRYSCGHSCFSERYNRDGDHLRGRRARELWSSKVPPGVLKKLAKAVNAYVEGTPGHCMAGSGTLGVDMIYEDQYFEDNM